MTVRSMQLIDYKEMLVITVVTDIALNARSRPVNARELENRHRLPGRHLEGLLQALVHEGILTGRRGPGGGYRLAREPGRITAEDILRAARTLATPQDLGRSWLLNKVVRPAMAPAENAFLEQLSQISIEDLMGRATRTSRAERA